MTPNTMDVPLPPVGDQEIDAILDIFRAYGSSLGVSGVVLGTAVVTRSNLRRVRFVMDEMERRGLIQVKYAALNTDDEDLFVLT